MGADRSLLSFAAEPAEFGEALRCAFASGRYSYINDRDEQITTTYRSYVATTGAGEVIGFVLAVGARLGSGEHAVGGLMLSVAPHARR